MSNTNDRRRKRTILILAVLCVMSFVAFRATAEDKKPPSPDSPGFANHVLDQIDDMYRGSKSQGVMEMKIKTKHWTRSLKMESWAMGKDYSLVRILKPKKERGTATLKSQKNLFIYLNKTGRTIKITSGMMGGSWMGSHFTNNDLVRHNRLAEQYKTRLSFRGEAAGQKVYTLTLQAKRDAPVVWDKIEVTVRQSDLLAVSQRFYDEEGKLKRVLSFSDYKELSGRKIPGTMTMKPTDKPGEFTSVTVRKLNLSVNLSKSFFSLQKLKSL